MAKKTTDINLEQTTEPTEPTEPTEQPVDLNDIAELLKDKDNKISVLEQEIQQLKKSNAEMVVRISAGNKPTTSFEETVLDFCDMRKVGQPTK